MRGISQPQQQLIFLLKSVSPMRRMFKKERPKADNTKTVAHTLMELGYSLEVFSLVQQESLCVRFQVRGRVEISC